jgi:hypothetical protein
MVWELTEIVGWGVAVDGVGAGVMTRWVGGLSCGVVSFRIGVTRAIRGEWVLSLRACIASGRIGHFRFGETLSPVRFWPCTVKWPPYVCIRTRRDRALSSING